MGSSESAWPGIVERCAVVLLVLAAVACAVGFATAWPGGLPLADADEVRLKAWACGGVAALVMLTSLRRVRERRVVAGGLLLIAGAIGVASWLNFGALHGGSFVHDWEQFHHRLGSRYFPELGYDGLYAASIAAQLEGAPRVRVQRAYRDLRTDRIRDTVAQLDHVREVRRRFDAQRWVEFVADHHYFVERHGGAQLDDMRRDHGFNATPAWATIARTVGAAVPSGSTGLALLGLLDPLLLGLAFALVFRSFGLRAGCLALALLGLGYASRFYWVGGAFLRQDWLAAVLCSIALLEASRPRAAGLLLGVAAGLRLFPVLLLFGPVVLALLAVVRRRRQPEAHPNLRTGLALGLGFGLGVASMLAVGSLGGRGPAAWGEFATEIRRHTGGWLTNDVGLANLVLYDRQILTGALVAPGLPDAWAPVGEEIARRRDERAAALLLSRIFFLALLAAAVTRATPARSVALSAVAVFSLTSPTCYYWSLLALVPLARGPTPGFGNAAGVVALLGLNAAVFLLHPTSELLELRFGVFSIGLAAVFLGWILPDAIRALREARAAAQRSSSAASSSTPASRSARIRSEG